MSRAPFPVLLAALTEAEPRLQLLDGLPHYGWRVLIASTAKEIPALAFQHTPDALLLDAGIVAADIPALEAVRIPRIVLGAAPNRKQRLNLHRELKVCSWLPLPLDVELLAAQLDAVIFGNRAEADPPPEGRHELLRAGEETEGWMLACTTWMLTPPQGKPVRLTQAETTFLATLAGSPGEPVLRPAMVVALGHNVQYYDTRRLDTMISRLRQKISRDAGVALPVRSIHSVGYAFAASIILAD